MNKTEQLINALSERFRTLARDSAHVDSMVLAYLGGLLGELEKSDAKLRDDLNFHLRGTLSYNAEQKSRSQEVA